LRNHVPVTTLASVDEKITPTRRLAAILLADVAGYSRMMERDEHGTHVRLRDVRAAVIDPAISRHHGRPVRSKGDDVLVEFASAVEALSAAVEIQRELAERNRDLAPDSRIELRIGINLGDILIDGGEIAGDGVNVAARLQALAEPGEIAISAAIREQVRQLKSVQLVDAGHHRVKNLNRPIRVYKVRVQGTNRMAALKWLRRRLPARALVAALAMVAALGALLVLAPWAGREAERRSLAVLPFESSAGEAGNALARSLTADTTMTLAQMLGGAVAAPSAVATASAQISDPVALGARLHVRYLLEGDLEKSSSSEIRLQVRLLDAVSGRQLWSNRLTAVVSAGEPVPLELIGPLVNKVAGEIRRAELARHGQTGADATELVLRGWTLLPNMTTDAHLNEVRSLFARALQLAPDNVEALAGAAYLHDHEANRAGTADDSRRLLQTADTLSLRAISLRTNSAVAWRARATVLQSMEQLDAAAEATERALAINPYDSEAQAQRGQILLMVGRAEEAVAALDKAIRLNPDNETVGVHLNTRCRALLYLARYDEAIASCRRGMAFAPDWPDYMLLASAYALRGDAKNAALARDELLRREPKFTIAWLRSKSSSPHPVTAAQREAQLIAGLRKAGFAEQ
jgi:adenylate cyclase